MRKNNYFLIIIIIENYNSSLRTLNKRSNRNFNILI